jgi:hypothetical protein
LINFLIDQHLLSVTPFLEFFVFIGLDGRGREKFTYRAATKRRSPSVGSHLPQRSLKSVIVRLLDEEFLHTINLVGSYRHRKRYDEAAPPRTVPTKPRGLSTNTSDTTAPADGPGADPRVEARETELKANIKKITAKRLVIFFIFISPFQLKLLTRTVFFSDHFCITGVIAIMATGLGGRNFTSLHHFEQSFEH